MEWISVKDKLPKIKKYVFILFRGGSIYKGYLVANGWLAHTEYDTDYKADFISVTHWMPLPELPKEDA